MNGIEKVVNIQAFHFVEGLGSIIILLSTIQHLQHPTTLQKQLMLYPEDGSLSMVPWVPWVLPE